MPCRGWWEITHPGTLGSERTALRDSRRAPVGDKPAPKAVVGRVSLYLRQLESFRRSGLLTVSSSQLGAALAIHDAQVRKDLAFFGQFGHPGVGYRIEELTDALRRILGIDHDWPLALVGLGNLGRALLKYQGFRDRGFQIVSLFDNDPHKIGKALEGLTIRPLDTLAESVREQRLNLSVLSVPAEVAQPVADQLVASGIVGIFNFAPISLVVPNHVRVVAVDLSIQLEHLAYQIQRGPSGISCAS